MLKAPGGLDWGPRLIIRSHTGTFLEGRFRMHILNASFMVSILTMFCLLGTELSQEGQHPQRLPSYPLITHTW